MASQMHDSEIPSFWLTYFLTNLFGETHWRLFPGAEWIAYARFFNPTLGIFEEAATGTPAGPLACQLVARQLAKDGSTLQIEQGYAMGRPRLIRVHVSGTALQVSRSAFISGRGNLRVE